MRWLTLAVAVAATVTQVTAKAVFAHFMVGNTENYTTSDWLDDMRQAKKAHIDAFALNMAHGEETNEKSLAAAFSAAASEGMQLFFSFDYAGNGPWPKQTVIEYIAKYGSSSAYFHHNGRPFVSTFEGPDQADDWIDIKSQTSCFSMPDWSSLGAKKAMTAGGGVADGLFSWAAWAWGDWNMYMYTDASYAQYMNGKPYMMPVSPWFYTNLPGYNKNWLWRGDRAWGDRWIQAQWWQPEFIQIISWNDYGESHYIGPVRKHAMGSFDIGRAPYNYATLPHDGWRDILPFVIDMYKNNVATIDHERIVTWYTLVDPTRCNHNGTVANTASQLQQEFEPEEVMDNKIHFAALLKGKPDKVLCDVGGSITTGKFYQGPDNDGTGMYLGECDKEGGTGIVRVIVTRGQTTITVFGDAISSDCSRWNGFTNYNAHVASGFSTAVVNAQAADISQAVCVNGTGMHVVKDLCEFTCSLGYCPQTACVCTRLEHFAHPGNMKSPGLKYFDCVVSINGKKYSDKQGCQYIVLERLPVDNWHIDYTLRDAEGFFAEVDEKLGIVKEWITFGECECDDSMYGDDGAHIWNPGRPGMSCKPKITSMSNFPIAIAEDKIEVPNPKLVLEAAMAKMTSLVYSLLTGHFLVSTSLNEVDSADIVKAASMPVFMLQQAVDAMNSIKKTGADIIKQNKKKLITLILSIVLMVLPIIGEIGGALIGGMAMVARIITLIDIAGNVGMAAYDIVEDPQSAPFAIMGMLMGFAGGTRSEKDLAAAGNARKAMPDSAVTKLGKVFTENDRKVQNIINACRWK